MKLNLNETSARLHLPPLPARSIASAASSSSSSFSWRQREREDGSAAPARAFRIMAADSRSPRDGKHLEVLGYYNPLPGQDGGKRMGLKFDRVKYWLSVGAQPSEPVQRILFRAGMLPPPPVAKVEHEIHTQLIP